MKSKFLPAEKREIIQQAFGQSIWFASGKLGNTEDVTLGQVFIQPGKCTSVHSHPNCCETIHVLKGTIMHTAEEGKEVQMRVGDTITVWPGFVHTARNVGSDEAVLLVAFSSASRQTDSAQ